MDMKRKLAFVGLTLAVAVACGQFVQYGFGTGPRQASLPAESAPMAIVPLAAGADAVIPTPPVEVPTPRLPDQAMVPVTRPDAPATVPLPAEPVVADACPVQFDLTAQPDAMLGLSLLAPCRPGERLVLRHAGLAISAKTSATGSVFLTLPALERIAGVSVLFRDGDTISASTVVPDIITKRRFAVQWMADDNFQLHAFEGDADYDTPGHVSAADPNRPAAGVPAKGGYLSVLGDSEVDLPMLAEVYTFPAGDTPVRITVEAAVTDMTCERDLLGETLASVAGKVTTTDLTVTMPTCDAIGDYLVLNNLLPDMNIATAK